MSKSHDGYSALMVWIPEDLHQRFKMYCVKNRTPQKTVIIDFLQNLTGDTNDKGKSERNSREDEKK